MYWRVFLHYKMLFSVAKPNLIAIIAFNKDNFVGLLSMNFYIFILLRLCCKQ